MHKPTFSLSSFASCAVQSWLMKLLSLLLQELQSIPPRKTTQPFNPKYTDLRCHCPFLPPPTNSGFPNSQQFTFSPYKTVVKAQYVPNSSSARIWVLCKNKRILSDSLFSAHLRLW